MSERRDMLEKMRHASSVFYVLARQTGCHAFIEFTGLMNEYIAICEAAEAAGIDWTMANTHTDAVLPMAPYHVRYLAEKLDCIYGPALRDPQLRREFVDAILFMTAL